MAKPNPRPIPPLRPQDIERFWKFVDKTPGQGPKGDCWGWRGGKQDFGYGTFGIRRCNQRGITFNAHRISYFLKHGVDPIGQFVLHKCDNPQCCNPEHLFLGTNADNLADMRAKGRYGYPRACGDRNGSRTHPERLRRGEAATGSKLTVDDVRAIRASADCYRVIGARFHISSVMVGLIKRRLKWKHVE